MPILGETKPEDHRAVYRCVTGEEGTVDLVADFEPRFDYARTVPSVERTEYGVHADADEETVPLSSSIALDQRRETVADTMARATSPTTLDLSPK